MGVVVSLAFVTFGFAAFMGIAPVVYLSLAAGFGGLNVGALLLAVRFRSYVFLGFGCNVLVVGHHISEVHMTHVTPETWSWFAQWLAVAVVFMGCPVLIYHQAIIRVCDPKEPCLA